MLYIMRHGRTDWNLQYRLQGSVDIPLNEEGRRMAREAAENYRDIHLDICFVSPLSRARETAEIFLEGRDVPIVVDQRLREMSFGRYEGMDHIYQKPDLPIYKLFQDPERYEPEEGAESFAELFARTGEFIRQEAEPRLAKGQDILIIGHGAMNSAIVSQYRKKPLSEFWENDIENCKLIRLA